MNVCPKFIDYKIKVLKEFCILAPNAKKKETAIRNILSGCRNEYEADAKLHDVLYGNETLDDMLTRKGVSICL